jgi:hypothetical protein
MVFTPMIYQKKTNAIEIIDRLEDIDVVILFVVVISPIYDMTL